VASKTQNWQPWGSSHLCAGIQQSYKMSHSLQASYLGETPIYWKAVVAFSEKDTLLLQGLLHISSLSHGYCSNTFPLKIFSHEMVFINCLQSGDSTCVLWLTLHSARHTHILFAICHLSHVFSLQTTTAVTFGWEKPRFVDF